MEGTQVLLRNSHKDTKKGDKMKPRWLGPYTIHKYLKKGVYNLKNQNGYVLKSALNQYRLKVYHTANDNHKGTVCSSLIIIIADIVLLLQQKTGSDKL